ncbi:TetR/AcrR family transcriptional regulator [Pseudoclavibacter helvolus]|uniref:TetR/AcrR family transcriptional regulator n=1 Tax=Pseudoclavibacter helvolus TaxID=255205 RepID=UPI0037355D24
MPTKTELLDVAVEVLRRGDALTLNAVAGDAGISKPGVVYHFTSKESLSVEVVDHIVDRWERELRAHAGDSTKPLDLLRSYVDYAVTGEFDLSDLALLADVKIRDSLCEQWSTRMSPWLGLDIEGGPGQRASLRAARLLADGAWFNKALGITITKEDELPALRSIALALVNQGDTE